MLDQGVLVKCFPGPLAGGNDSESHRTSPWWEVSLLETFFSVFENLFQPQTTYRVFRRVQSDNLKSHALTHLRAKKRKPTHSQLLIPISVQF